MRRVLSLGDLLVIAAAAVGPAFVLATVFGPMVVVGGSATPLALVLVSIVMVCIAIGYGRLGERYRRPKRRTPRRARPASAGSWDFS